MTGQEVSRKTRQDIFDFLSAEGWKWSGRLDDVAFLRRLWDLKALPSTDYRYKTAEHDISQHRVSFADWPDDWIFTDPRFDLLGTDDGTFLNFLSEMVHPVVRPDVTETARLVQLLNDLLSRDGFELAQRGTLGERPLWSARGVVSGQSVAAVANAKAVFDADYIRTQLTRMETSVENDPGLAIGTAKELVETTCKAIIEQRHMERQGTAKLPKLVRSVADELDLVPETVVGASAADDTLRRVLGSLAMLVDGIAELRNSFGTGHGREPSRKGLDGRHARLVVESATAVSVFLWETHLATPSAKAQGTRG
jgi:AbiJ-like protein/abortive infection Abi-like protein